MSSNARLVQRAGLAIALAVLGRVVGGACWRIGGLTGEETPGE